MWCRQIMYCVRVAECRSLEVHCGRSIASRRILPDQKRARISRRWIATRNTAKTRIYLGSRRIFIRWSGIRSRDQRPATGCTFGTMILEAFPAEGVDTLISHGGVNTVERKRQGEPSSQIKSRAKGFQCERLGEKTNDCE